MIPVNTSMKSCVGRKATVDRNLSNGFGTISAGTEVRIVGSSSRGMSVSTETCPCCGISLLMTRVGKDCLTLVNEPMRER